MQQFGNKLPKSEHKKFHNTVMRSIGFGTPMGDLVDIIRRISTIKQQNNNGRSRSRINDIQAWLTKSHGPYLDIGCGDGMITNAVAEYTGFETYGIDVKAHPPPMLRHKYIRAMENMSYPLEYEKYGLITAHMTLHHIHFVQDRLQDIYAACAPGGYFIIREHDLHDTDGDTIMYIRWIHHFWDIVDHTFMAYEIYYKSAKQWKKLIELTGFKEIDRKTWQNDLHAYIALYQKV